MYYVKVRCWIGCELIDKYKMICGWKFVVDFCIVFVESIYFFGYIQKQSELKYVYISI